MKLLLETARCPVVEHCLGGATDHPCSKIVQSQGVRSLADFQLPEPWSGHIAQSPILFLSSNPSIGITLDHEYPRATWDDASIVDYFENRFGDSPLSSVADGICNHLPGGQRSQRSVRYWAGVRARAGELLEKPVRELRPGYDYALSEIVHCKSTKEWGVREALRTCADRYLEPTLAASGAGVIVIVGAHAAEAIRSRYHLEPGEALYGPLHIGGRQRLFALIPHPSSFGNQTFAKCLGKEKLQRLRGWIRG